MRALLPLLAALACSSAFAQESQIKRAAAALDDAASGDTEALAAAVIAVDRAVIHKKTASSGPAWVLKGRIYTAVALQGGIPSAEAVDSAVAAWEGAVERGAGRDAISADLAKLLSATTLILRDDLESKRIDEAWKRVDAAMRGRTMLEYAGWQDPRLEVPLLELAILTAIRADKLEEAKTWFADWRALDASEPAVAVQVAAAIAAAEGPDPAIAFLEPMLQTRPLNPAMLTRTVDILIAAERIDEAKARIQVASAAKAASSSGAQLLLADLHGRVGDSAAARAAYESALGQNPESAEAWLPLARLLMAEPPAPEAPAEGEKKSRSEIAAAQKAAAAARTADLERALQLIEKARDATGGAPDRATLAAMVEIYGLLERPEDQAEAEKALQASKGSQ